jgi:hypothetical protein
VTQAASAERAFAARAQSSSIRFAAKGEMMLVHRTTFVVKVGKRDEAVEVLKSGADYLEKVPTFRVYGSSIGPRDTLVLELEFENLAEYERFWDEWFATPESAAVMEKWVQLREPGGTSEIWQLL